MNFLEQQNHDLIGQNIDLSDFQLLDISILTEEYRKYYLEKYILNVMEDFNRSNGKPFWEYFFTFYYKFTTSNFLETGGKSVEEQHTMNLWFQILSYEEIVVASERDFFSAMMSDPNGEFHKKFYRLVKENRQIRYTNVVLPYLKKAELALRPFAGMDGGIFSMILEQAFESGWDHMITEKFMRRESGRAKAINNGWLITKLKKTYKGDAKTLFAIETVEKKLKESVKDVKVPTRDPRDMLLQMGLHENDGDW